MYIVRIIITLTRNMYMEEEKKELLYALAQMYSQYCGDEAGHECMSAGEHAQEILERAGVLTGTNGWGGNGTIDWKKLGRDY